MSSKFKIGVCSTPQTYGYGEGQEMRAKHQRGRAKLKRIVKLHTKQPVEWGYANKLKTNKSRISGLTTNDIKIAMGL